MRQVETEILQYKIAGEGSGTRVTMAGYVDASQGGVAGSRQIPGTSQQAGILPGRRRSPRARSLEPPIQQQQQQQGTKIVNNGKQDLMDPARLIAELRARETSETENTPRKKKKRTEMWEEMLAMKRHLDEHRTQMSEFALRSADRVASLETRLNMRENLVLFV